MRVTLIAEKEQEELNELENLLKKHDPDFQSEFSWKCTVYLSLIARRSNSVVVKMKIFC